MSRSKKQRISTESDSALGQNPFAALSSDGLPSGEPARTPAPAQTAKPPKSRGRVDLRREKSGRGGKTVTVVDGLVTMETRSRNELALKLRQKCACGGAVVNGRIELQGDQRDKAAEILSTEGFRVVRAGG